MIIFEDTTLNCQVGVYAFGLVLLLSSISTVTRLSGL